MVAVNPEILVWARESQALSVEEAARKLRFKDTTRSSAESKLLLLETGKKEPSRSKLNDMATTYRQPLLAFYLSEPPRKGNRGTDFRSLVQRSRNPRANAFLDILMRNVKAAQSLVRDILEDDEFKPLDFVGSMQTRMGEDAVAKGIIATLNFDLHHFRRSGSYSGAFAYLRDLIESKGIFVLRLSDLGNHHSRIPVEVFRGFVYADPFAPFMVINRNDAKSAYSFTALHELAHLWIGSSGVSGELQPDTEGIESFCDRVAARVLLRANDIKALSHVGTATHAELVDTINERSSNWKISRTMIAYNLLRENVITVRRWEDLRMQFRQEYLKQKQIEKEERASRDNIPFDMNGIFRNNLGKLLVNLTRTSLSEGTLTSSKAAVVLGATPRRVHAILNP